MKRLFGLLLLGFIVYAVFQAGDAPWPKTAAQVPQRKATCTAADFEIIGFKSKLVDDCRVTPCPVLKLTGKLKNNCASPAGAQIKITAEDGKGNVVDTIEGWPASIKNIEPSQSYSFDLGPMMTYRPGMKSFHVDVIDTRSWRDR
jgi:hypothetical protein